MAVYTEVGDTELEAFLAEYDIGEADSFKGVAEGVENSNYLLTTTRGQYFLTLYEKRVDPKDLPFFLGLLDHLSARGINCPKPIHGRRRGAGGAAPRRQGFCAEAAQCAVGRRLAAVVRRLAPPHRRQPGAGTRG